MIRRNDIAHFLDQHDLTRPEAWHYLPQFFGRLCFSFQGYDDRWSFDPELRRFWRVLHECWPHWTLFLDLAQHDLKVMIFGCLKRFRLITIPGQTNGGRIRSKGFAHRELTVTWTVLTHNLWVLARMRIDQAAAQRRAVA